MIRYIQGVDVDTDEMAAVLRRFADGLESHDIPVTAVSTETDVPGAEQLTEHAFRIQYNASHDYADVVDILRFATDAYIRFADRYVGEILSGDKTMTVRYDFERELTPGDTAALVDESDDKFATVTIEAYVEMPIRRVCEFGIGDYEAVDVDELVDTMRELYPADADLIDADTYVTVILFSDVDPYVEYSIEHD